ncbi:hypothetical protein HIM_00717 [Hirsutella minnesotensis 3608]|nr:hypothetical protein HIM_00717 [Hirsutella minnesotensis 3608]
MTPQLSTPGPPQNPARRDEFHLRLHLHHSTPPSPSDSGLTQSSISASATRDSSPSRHTFAQQTHDGARALERMAAALPAHPDGDETSDLASSYEAVALLIHAYLAALDFGLCGFAEDKPLSPQDAALAPRLPAQWNAGFGSLSFVYAHKQSSMRFVVRVDRMGGRRRPRGPRAPRRHAARRLCLGAGHCRCVLAPPCCVTRVDEAVPLRTPLTRPRFLLAG